MISSDNTWTEASTAVSDNVIVISSDETDCWPRPEPMSDEDRRLAQYLENMWAFEDFIAGCCRGGPEEGRHRSRSPYEYRILRKYGTSNGLRPEPMLC